MKTAEHQSEGEESSSIATYSNTWMSKTIATNMPMRRMSSPEHQSSKENVVTSVPTNGATTVVPMEESPKLNKDMAIRCTVATCTCECFVPGKMHIRRCQTCLHDWVPHALDKLGCRAPLSPQSSSAEAIAANRIFDLASLVLYGSQALPIRLKILLDRLFSSLSQEEIHQVLHGFGWSYEDYTRGYILQDSHGNVLDRWSLCSREEEPLVLQQFLRFSETRNLAQHLLSQDIAANNNNNCSASGSEKDKREKSFVTTAPSRVLPSDSDIKKIFEKTHHHSRINSLVTSSNLTSSVDTPTIMKHHHRNHNNVLNDLAPIPGLPPGLPLNLLRFPPGGPLGIPPPLSSLSNGPIPPRSSVSPLSLSPLNRLQSMHPLNFRKEHRESNEHPMSLAVNQTPVDLSPGSDPGGSDDENSDMALNLSRRDEREKEQEFKQERESDDGNGIVDGEEKRRHMRKASTPMKRSWTPINLGSSFINPSTGKKRVQCNVCLKTFCDKGALKIHFSAVHLREMHRCTVEGCNMMFSSRRSRNRHSANPNPKLHSPHLRRKISPHDGRSCHSHPLLGLSQNLLSPMGGSHFSSMGPLPMTLLTPPPDMSRQNQEAKHGGSSLDLSMMKYEDGDKRLDLSVQSTTTTSSDDMRMLDMSNHDAKRVRLSDSDDDDDGSSLPDTNDSLSIDNHSIKEENPDNPLAKAVRKRKSLNPTRCAVQMNDDDDLGCSSDDSSAGNVVINHDDTSQDAKDHQQQFNEHHQALFAQMKAAAEETERLRAAMEHSAMEDNPIKEEHNCNEIKTSLVPLMDKIKKEKTPEEQPEDVPVKEEDKSADSDHEDMDTDDPKEDEEEAQNLSKPLTAEELDSANCLRRLESLSQGHFGELLTRNILASGQAGLLPPLHFPLHLIPPYPTPASPGKSIDRDHGSDKSGSNPDSPCPDTGSNQNSPFMPLRDSFISSLDVPLDKDNPRRCSACGKIFQNHFGVKTHYQNVHLKLMHKCTVEGCNAAFPSKRSRDRHSANLNLHRKLLSTSSDKPSYFTDSKNPLGSALAANQSLHSDFLARLYSDAHALPLGLEAYKAHLPPSLAEHMLVNGERLPPSSLPHPPLLLPALGVNSLAANLSSLSGFNLAGAFTHLNGSGGHHFDFQDDHSSIRERRGSTGSSSSRPTSPTNFVLKFDDDDIPSLNSDGRLPCKFCNKTLSNSSDLQRHFEHSHSNDLYRCSVQSCKFVFISRKRRHQHIQSDYHNNSTVVNTTSTPSTSTPSSPTESTNKVATPMITTTASDVS